MTKSQTVLLILLYVRLEIEPYRSFEIKQQPFSHCCGLIWLEPSRRVADKAAVFPFKRQGNPHKVCTNALCAQCKELISIADQLSSHRQCVQWLIRISHPHSVDQLKLGHKLLLVALPGSFQSREEWLMQVCVCCLFVGRCRARFVFDGHLISCFPWSHDKK